MEILKKFSIFCCSDDMIRDDIERAKEAILDPSLGEPKEEHALAEPNMNMQSFNGVLWQRKPSTSKENTGIKTLGEALIHFDLLPRFKQIEESLKDVRRHRKSRKDHESDVKQFDKEILKLCHKHHPDRVKNRGGTDEEIETAKNLQASLNAIRTVFSILNKIFLDNIGVDHMYGFCTGMSISSIENEDVVRQHVFEVFYKISYVSEIKQQDIIPSIRAFLLASQDCLNSFMEGKMLDFETNRDAALSYLKNCIMGYKKLKTELETVVKSAKGKSLDNIRKLIEKMSSDCERDLDMLKEVKDVAKVSLNGRCKMFWTRDPKDDYFVLPFVLYVNAISMCNVMVAKGNKSVLTKRLGKILNDDAYKHLGIDVKVGEIFSPLFYIASCFSDNNEYYENVVRRITKGEDENMEDKKPEVEKNKKMKDEKQEGEKKDENMKVEKPEDEKKDENMKDEKPEDEKKDENMKDEKPEVENRKDGNMKDEKMQEGCDSKKYIIKLFREHLKKAKQYLEEEYRAENYVERSSFVDNYTECLRMMEEFNEKEKKMREGLERLDRKHKDIEEMLENMFTKSSEVGNETKYDLEEEQNNS